MNSLLRTVVLLVVVGVASTGRGTTATLEVHPEEGVGGGLDVYQQTLHFKQFDGAKGVLLKTWMRQSDSAAALLAVTNDTGSTASIVAQASGWLEYDFPSVYATGDFPNRHFVFGQAGALDVPAGGERVIDLGSLSLGPYTDNVYGSFLMLFQGNGMIAFNFSFHVDTQVDPSVPRNLTFNTLVDPVLYYEYEVPEPACASMVVFAVAYSMLRGRRKVARGAA